MGESIRLYVRFDGATTSLGYSKLGWSFVEAFTGLNLTDVNIETHGFFGAFSYAMAGSFAEFRAVDGTAYGLFAVAMGNFEAAGSASIASSMLAMGML